MEPRRRAFPSAGRLRVTGTVGPMTRESANVAMTWVRSHAERLVGAARFDDTTDVHVHLAEAARWKDGPSAGVNADRRHRVRLQHALNACCSLQTRHRPAAPGPAKRPIRCPPLRRNDDNFRLFGQDARKGSTTAQEVQESRQYVVYPAIRRSDTSFARPETTESGPLQGTARGRPGRLKSRTAMTIEELHVASIESTIEHRTRAKRQRALTVLLEYARTQPTRVIVPGDTPILIWSDLHLRHANIIRYCSRPFENADAMDRSLMKAWHDHADDSATVINGGDVALSGRLTGKLLKAVKTAPGHKILVAGNHEVDKKTGKIRSHGHDEVCPMATFETDPPAGATETAGRGSRRRPLPSRAAAPPRTDTAPPRGRSSETPASADNTSRHSAR